MKRVVLCLALGVLPVSGARAGPETDREMERAGDAMQVGVPLVALGLTFFLDEPLDAEGELRLSPADALGLDTGWLSMNGSPRHDLMLAIGRTEVMTYSLKYGVDEQRPNGGGQSFPSGHTSIAFAGAEFIRKEYGWGYGVPAYAAASFVGWSRVESHNHWTHDVLAGAVIGIFSNHDGLSFHLPSGEHGLDFSVAPALMTRVTARPGLFGFESPGEPDQAEVEAPAAGLRFALRF